MLQIAFTTPRKKNPLSSFIMWIEKRDYSHVIISWFSPSLNRTLVFQANMNGAVFVNGQKFFEENSMIKSYTLNLPPMEIDRIKTWAIDVAGVTSYDIPGLFKVGINKFLTYLRLPTIKFKQNGIKLAFCSELVGHILKPIFKDELEAVKLDFLSPSDLDKILSRLASNGTTIKLIPFV